MTPDVGDLCMRGERAFSDDEIEEAVAWYELACAGTYLRQEIRHPSAVPRYTDDRERLIANRFERYAELRQLVPWRSVQRLAAPDPGHALIVMSCAGREGYSSAIHKAISRNWWRGKFTLIMDSTRQGQAQTFFEALRRAAETPGFVALTLLEDDIVLAKNALDYIAMTKIDPDLGFVSWFSNETCTIPRIQPVLACRPARDYMFNQAITFPAKTVHELLASDALKNWSEPHGADRIYGHVFPDRMIAVHYPNLVQHIGGANSAVGNNDHGLRTSPTFLGEDVDALGLVR